MPETAQGSSSGIRVYTVPNNIFLLKVAITLFVVALLIILGLEVYLVKSGRITPLIVNLIGSDKIVETSKFTVPANLLTNTIIYGWRGSVAGIVSGKDEHHFTVQGKNQSLTIFVEPTSLTHFWSKPLKKEIKLSELPIGTLVTGSVWIFNSADEVIVGSLFDVDNPR